MMNIISTESTVWVCAGVEAFIVEALPAVNDELTLPAVNEELMEVAFGAPDVALQLCVWYALAFPSEAT